MKSIYIWLSALTLIFVIGLGYSQLRFAAKKSPPEIWYGNRMFSAREFFPDNNVAALAEAAAAGNSEEIESQISKGADLNYIGKNDYTPLMWSIETHSLKGFKQLLDHGARLDIPNRFSMSAMALASGPANSAEFIELAVSHGGNPNFVEVNSGDTPIYFAIRSGDIKRVETLIRAGADVNAANKKHVTPLIECATTAEYRAALLLLKTGADYRLRDLTGSDFIAAMKYDRHPPFWMPSYWWRQRVVAFLSNQEQMKNTAKQ